MKLLLLSNAKREGMGYLEHAAGYRRDSSGRPFARFSSSPYAGLSTS